MLWQEQEWLHHFCCCLVAKKCDPVGCSPLDSFVHGISEVRILEWVTISFSRGSSRPRDWTYLSCTCRQVFFLSFFFNHWAIRETPCITLPSYIYHKRKMLILWKSQVIYPHFIHRVFNAYLWIAHSLEKDDACLSHLSSLAGTVENCLSWLHWKNVAVPWRKKWGKILTIGQTRKKGAAGSITWDDIWRHVLKCNSTYKSIVTLLITWIC